MRTMIHGFRLAVIKCATRVIACGSSVIQLCYGKPPSHRAVFAEGLMGLHWLARKLLIPAAEFRLFSSGLCE
jgi:hypothetical protein